MIFSRDGQDGENGRVSYHFKVSNQNVDQTNEFIIDTTTGEIRAKTKFDREMKDRYELVLVARDHGKPVSFETLRFVSIVIKDVNDHEPMFKTNEEIRFTVISRIFFLNIFFREINFNFNFFLLHQVPEEEDPGYFVGRVEASDPDEGKNGRVFYYIINGNNGKWFSIDRTYGHIYTKKKLDREERDNYVIQVHTTNNANHVCEGSICDIDPVVDPSKNDSVILVHIFVEDKNDNLPQFETDEFNIGK